MFIGSVNKVRVMAVVRGAVRARRVPGGGAAAAVRRVRGAGGRAPRAGGAPARGRARARRRRRRRPARAAVARARTPGRAAREGEHNHRVAGARHHQGRARLIRRRRTRKHVCRAQKLPFIPFKTRSKIAVIN